MTEWKQSIFNTPSSLKEDQAQNTVKKLILTNVFPWDSKQNTKSDSTEKMG